MEGFYMILGLIMFYTWIHSTVIIAKNLKKVTGYETTVLITAVSFFVLYIIGTIN
jgi:hypothetical protein